MPVDTIKGHLVVKNARLSPMMNADETQAPNKEWQEDGRQGDAKPYQRFRRSARVVMMLLKVCRVCQNMVLKEVTAEKWYRLAENFVEDQPRNQGLFAKDTPAHRKPSPFVTFVANEKKELIQLSFDKTSFSREHSREHLLNDDIRSILAFDPATRTTEQLTELMRFMKKVSPTFQQYPLDLQRSLVKCMEYNRFGPNRVITRQNGMADGIYFVLSGILISKSSEKRSLSEIRPGEKFGEDDLKCGCARRSTVITRSSTEVISIHRLDYRMIFNMAHDSNDPRYLDICKRHIVFQHFPMKHLRENPGVWTVLSYRFGRLIVEDSNSMEWIYIIKSGEASVIKRLYTEYVDLDERRRKIDAKVKQNDPYHQVKKMMTFINDKQHTKSNYKMGQYNPSTSFRQKSAPAMLQGHSQGQGGKYQQSLQCFRRPHTDMRSRCLNQDHDHSEVHSARFLDKKDKLVSALTRRPDPVRNGQERSDIEITEEDLGSLTERGTRSTTAQCRVSICDPMETKCRSRANFVQTPSLPQIRRESFCKSRMARVPPFVQLESLFTGDVFGLRSCLEPEERGPNASLVSRGCEVLQINKKFFMKYADEAIYSLIKFKAKPFPHEDELLDRLDANFQWDEYKHSTVLDYLRYKGKDAQPYSQVTIS